jgi:hypothetical protein
MTMKLGVFLLLFFLLPALAGSDREPAREAAAHVRAGANGGPCFTVGTASEQQDGTAQFRGLTVVDTVTHAIMWQMALPSGRSFPLTYTVCIPYAGRVAALPQTPAAALADGRMYQVTLAVRNWNRPAAPRAYSATFCLAGPARAVTVVRDGQICPSSN